MEDYYMKEPHLLILPTINGAPVRGRCSCCKNVVFYTGVDVGVPDEHQSKLDELFRKHFRKVHLRADAAAALQ
jgi:hypothetical protein